MVIESPGLPVERESLKVERKARGVSWREERGSKCFTCLRCNSLLVDLGSTTIVLFSTIKVDSILLTLEHLLN